MIRRVVVRAGLLAVLLIGCNKEPTENAPPAVAPLPADEAARGKQACDAYVVRICACAETRPEFADECTLARARPQAFALNLELGTAPGLEPAELKAVKVEARKIAAACFEADAKIDNNVCPRSAP